MKQIFTIIFFFVFLFSFAQTNSNHVYVSGYYKSNGTYVQPHYRTAPNRTNRDNFSTRGNTNPYTGEKGYITPDGNASSTYTTNSYSNTNTTYPITTYNSTSTSTSNNSYNSTSIYTTTSSYGQLWREPSLLDAIRPIEKGSRVKVIEYEDEFYKVISNGTIGYINIITINENSKMRSLKKGEKEYSNSTESKAKVNEIFDIEVSKIYILPSKFVSAREANLRLGPTTITNVLTTIKQNDKIRIIDNSTYSSWTKIIVEADNGFYIGFLSNSLISDNKIENKEQIDGPTSVVKSFLKHLDKEEFYSAFSLTNNPSWNKNGGYSWFSSTDAYGGIDYVTIYEVRLENAYDDQAVVFADYYASDPLHTSRRWKQILILEYQYGKWKIVKTKLVE
ncbi:SH3 domain-containing protein [Lacinutrix himadriensis]|uniref:SH3 domain-containing protein n=1 Tax=Lacinutrix himadriensis TaxID=641549 RepID=UPI000A9B54B7|nr:SH3 domain-containing protein [Lacinutrix himadriensis]